MRTLALSLILLALAGPAPATTYAPLDDAALLGASTLVVTGTVVDVRTVQSRGRVLTRTRLAVDRVLKGASRAAYLTVTTSGGRAGNKWLVVFGTPSFTAGERVLTFLRRTRRGEWRPTALGLGTYRLRTAGDGKTYAERLAPFRDVRPLASLAAAIGASLTAAPPSTAATASGDLLPETARFTFLGPPFARWFEADGGGIVRYRVASADPALGAATSNAVIDAAFAAWNDVPTAKIELARGTNTTPAPSVAGGTCDGKSTIMFNDPEHEIEDLVQCAGVLAVGGFCVNTTTGVLNGQSFRHIVEGDLTVADGLGACAGLATVEETVTHEVGHTIGLGHSSEKANEANAVLRDATMYFLIHSDGRGASLRQDDIDGVTALYPVSTDPNDTDGDGVPNSADLCPTTPARTAVDGTGCGCGEAGHVPCDDGLSCTADVCNPSTGSCDAPPIDCTGGDPCLIGSCDETTGCSTAPVIGDVAATCALARGFPPSSCLGDRFPRSAKQAFRRAGKLAAGGVARGKTGRVARAARKLARGARAVERAAGRRRAPLGGTCATDARSALDDAQSRLLAWLAQR